MLLQLLNTFQMSSFRVDTMIVTLTILTRNILVHVLYPFTELYPMVRIVYVDLSSSVEVFGLPDLHAWASETVLLNFMISFATESWVSILVQVQYLLTDLYPMVRIVICEMLEHLQLVWVPLSSQQTAHDTALADSHLRGETPSPFRQTPGHRC
ncbi:hypothetical protein AVEN_23948-1 [Araneus ventricosus]|uniref:Uncharacterized protein n=1 Tax=Araneus ventricosus TaxID=182803 RepID=A0A4Y2R636_ARAVE|nr:hypothetical protein AVEN_248417-1 [Araneus ventricosus]GBN71168.1 hypothetical protein AVEN_23948-1 [Araneus ventricosus]